MHISFSMTLFRRKERAALSLRSRKSICICKVNMIIHNDCTCLAHFACWERIQELHMAPYGYLKIQFFVSSRVSRWGSTLCPPDQLYPIQPFAPVTSIASKHISIHPISVCVCPFSGNVAYKKKANQIDEKTNLHSREHPASRAVDGNTDSNLNHSHCALPMTYKTNLTAWWKVDLDDTYRIYSVVIYNRKDKFWRLNEFRLSVGNSSQSEQLVQCATHSGLVARSGSVTTPCEAVGRYLEFRRSGIRTDKYVTGLCEVVVIAHRYIGK